MTTLTRSPARQYAWPLGGLLVLLSFGGAAWYTAGKWWPVVAQRLGYQAADKPADKPAHAGAAEHVVVSPQAQKSIGLVLGQLARRDFDRTITLPAIVAERPAARTSW